jgi:photosystem II stability/assembly factor-like uncharacterized protein
MPDTFEEQDELPPPPSTRPLPVDWAKLPGPPEIDGYDLGDLVGRGGMAVVYKARQRSLNRPVALKVLLVGPGFDPGEARRVRAEAEAIASLQHPNIVHVYEVGERDGRPYLLMEFVDGGTLADRINQGPIPIDQAVAWAEAIARGAHTAHKHGIVHRDLKPANVLMTADGVPKITDFGIARRLDDPADRTRTGFVVGTPAYMSPEQAEGRKGVGPAADVWAIGVILYELVTGRRPFDGESAFDLLRRVTSEDPERPSRVRPGIPARLEAICLKCLQKDPADRYPSAEALADDLARSRTPPPTAVPRRHWPVPVAVGAVAVVVALLAWRLTGEPEKVGPAGPDAGSSANTDGGAKAGGPSEPVTGEPRWDPFAVAADDGTFQHLAFPTRTVGYALSRKGVYRTDNGGTSWAQRAAGNYGRPLFLTFRDADHGWMGGDNLRETTDGGTTWAPVALTDEVKNVRAIALGADDWALLGGTAANGEAVLFRRKAAAWERLDPARWDGAGRPHEKWYVGGLAVAGPKDGWAVLFSAAEAGVVLHTDDRGDTWKHVWATDADLFHVHFADTERGWLAGSGGRLWATTDGGRRWVPQTNPAGSEPVGALAFARGGSFGIAPLPDGRTLLTADGESWRFADTGLRGSTTAAAVVDAGRGYVMTSDGRLARYTGPKE